MSKIKVEYMIPLLIHYVPTLGDLSISIANALFELVMLFDRITNAIIIVEVL